MGGKMRIHRYLYVIYIYNTQEPITSQAAVAAAGAAQTCTQQHIATTHCNTLQREVVAVVDSMAAVPPEMLCPVSRCVPLQHTAMHCNALQHTATHCSTL